MEDSMKLRAFPAAGVLLLLAVASTLWVSRGVTGEPREAPFDRVIREHVRAQVEEGRQIFRFDTFGDEEFWGGLLRLHEAIETVSPRTALAVGLKVDVDALPGKLRNDLRHGRVDLDAPANTGALLKANAVIGVTGFFDQNGRLRSMGIQCALCHSTVDDSFVPGIGRRLDGWANRDLNVGAIVALAPNLKPVADLLGVSDATLRAVLNSWGPGKFDAGVLMDGKALPPSGGPTLIPPAFGLAGVNLHTWTGWGSVTHWNAFVANLEMHGKGTFYDPRLNDPVRFPIAAANGFGNVRNDPDLITSKLAALHLYQLAIPAPNAPEGSFDREAAARGEILFETKARCATCHVPPLFTEPGWNMHRGDELGIDNFQADRAPDKHYRTAPLKGLWTHQRGGFYHDGRFPTLRDVIDNYNRAKGLGLTGSEVADLVQYLKSL
jgi:hypothetical protein